MKKVLNIIGNVVLWLFVAFAAVLTVFALSASKSESGLPNVLGKAFISIQSPSMSGTFEEGDLIIADIADDSAEQSSYEVDDVITFKFTKENADGSSESAINSHRIIEKNEENGVVTYKTKGDNNSMEDTYTVQSSDILAKYTGTKLTGIGNVLDYLRSKNGFLICIVLPLILFFLFELYRFIVVIVKSKSAKVLEDEDAIKQRAIEEYKASLAKENNSASEETSASDSASEKEANSSSSDTDSASTQSVKPNTSDLEPEKSEPEKKDN